jgi:hypothetical protein
MQHLPDSIQGVFFWWSFRLVQAASMANPKTGASLVAENANWYLARFGGAVKT